MTSMLIALPGSPPQAQAAGSAGVRGPAPAVPEPGRLSRLAGSDRPDDGARRPELEEATAEALDRAVVRLQEQVQMVRRNLEFSIDETTDRLVVKVVDAETEEVVRQIPSEEALALARRLEAARSAQQGLLLSTEA
ncbi:flagellar protein FlaG [Thiohalobacter sp.]|uniref:flagellar protein FlaG n=1 Tax=Thiohalobacter sp. TaxID=2025948 RepID=UPI002620F0F9|nr:flagellar protein FlaG [Thiohalobacter sp.]